MPKKVFFSLWILAALAALALTGATIGLAARAKVQASQGTTARLTGKSSLLYLREQPDRASTIVAILERGAGVRVTNSAIKGGQTYYHIETARHSGWIQAEYVSMDRP